MEVHAYTHTSQNCSEDSSKHIFHLEAVVAVQLSSDVENKCIGAKENEMRHT
jgi:hypothetical protein